MWPSATAIADRAYMARYTDFPAGLEAHLAARGPEWAAAITGLSVAEIEAFAALYCRTERAYIRVRLWVHRGMRNGAANLHAVTCLPTVTGKWRHEGGGAFWNNRAIYHWDKTLIEGLDARDTIGPRDGHEPHRRGADRRPRASSATGRRCTRC